MSDELQDLLNYITELNDPILTKKVATIILRYSNKENYIKYAQEMIPESVDIDLWELEAMVRPEKFEFPEPEIGQINVETKDT